MKPKKNLHAFLSFVGSSLLAVSSANAADGTWIGDTATNSFWTNTALWQGGTIADGADFSAFFTNNITGNRVIDLNGVDRTIGNITFTDSVSSHNLTIAGNILTLDVTTGVPVIDVTQSGRVLTITSGIAGTDGLHKTGDGQLLLSGIISHTGGTTVSGGELRLNSATATTGVANAGDVSLSGNGFLYTTGTNFISAGGLDVGTGGGQIRVAKNNNVSFAGALTGSGNLTFVDAGGSGTTPIYNFNSTANTFSGGMTLNLADVRVNSLGDSASNNIVYNIAGSTFALNTGATTGLVFNNRAIELANVSGTLRNLNTTHSFTVNTDLVATGASAKILTLDAAVGQTNAFNGVISNGTGGGTVGITKTGAGKWVLGSDSNSFTGGVTVSNGMLAFNSLSSSGGVILLGSTNNTGTLEYLGTGQSISRQVQINNQNATSGNGAILNNGTGALTFTASTFNISDPTLAGSAGTRNLTLGGNHTGGINEIRGAVVANAEDGLRPVAIIKEGLSTWSLAGTNTYTGTTTLNAGTLRLNYDTTANGNDTSKLSDTRALNLNGGTLQLFGGSHTEAVASTTINSGTTSITRPSGTSTLSLGSFTYTGGAVNFAEANIATTTSTNAGAGHLGTNGVARLTVAGADWARNDGAGNIVAYNGYTSFTGGATSANINYSTVGNATLDNNRGATTNTFKITTTGSGQSMDLNTRQLSLGSLLFAGAHDYSITNTTGRINTAFLLHNYGTNDAALTLGATNGLITQYGIGKTILTGNNAANVGINVFGGTVEFSNNLQIGTNTGVASIGMNNGTLIADTSGGDIALNNGGLNSRNISLGAGGGTLDVTGGNKLTVSGVVSAATATQLAPLTIGSASSDGIIEFTNANTYTGNTQVVGGTFLVNNTTGSGTGSGAVFVGASATLGGIGTVSGNTTIAGIHSPGMSPGIQTFGANLAYEGGATVIWELVDHTALLTNRGMAFDGINVGGTLSFEGATTIQLVFSGALNLPTGSLVDWSDSFWMDDYNGTAGWLIYSGATDLVGFDNFSISSENWVDGLGQSYFDFFGGNGFSLFQNGNDIYLNYNYVVIPEPRTALLGALGLLALLRRRRS